jgi:4-hydroxybenzoate polyprenyltransferase
MPAHAQIRSLLASPYARLMRLHQRTGIWLLLWPCWWSLALASPGLPPLRLLALFALGATVMRAAGCVVNDIADRRFDAQVERTRARPLASGELTVAQALACLTALLAIALLIALPMGLAVVAWSALALPLVATYPLMKRITWWPQLFLGLTFNWGALLGWVAVRGSVGIPAVALYLACIFWTLGYDTIYAHQDKKDDAAIGVKSTALLFGSATPRFVRRCYILATALLAAAGVLAAAGPFYFLGLILFAGQLFRQLAKMDLDSPESCRCIFASNATAGWLLMLGACLK